VGTAALNYYLQFVNAGLPYYTWNENQQNSLESFAAGKTAMVFAYQSDIEKIKKLGQKLNMRVARVPQPEGSEIAITQAEYWGFAVSRLSPSTQAAWDFISYTTTHPDAYLDLSGKPGATLARISQKTSDVSLSVFSEQALTARSWYQPDEEVVRNALNDAIAAVIAGRKNVERALVDAQQAVNTAWGELNR